MSAQTFLAYFTHEKGALAAEKILREKIYIVATKKYEAQAPDPDLSVSALMVGFLPNLAHGLYGTEGSFHAGMYLLIVVDETGHHSELDDIIRRCGGSITRQDS